jgi:hypothetical protein
LCCCCTGSVSHAIFGTTRSRCWRRRDISNESGMISPSRRRSSSARARYGVPEGNGRRDERDSLAGYYCALAAQSPNSRGDKSRWREREHCAPHPRKAAPDLRCPDPSEMCDTIPKGQATRPRPRSPPSKRIPFCLVARRRTGSAVERGDVHGGWNEPTCYRPVSIINVTTAA